MLHVTESIRVHPMTQSLTEACAGFCTGGRAQVTGHTHGARGVKQLAHAGGAYRYKQSNALSACPLTDSRSYPCNTRYYGVVSLVRPSSTRYDILLSKIGRIWYYPGVSGSGTLAVYATKYSMSESVESYLPTVQH